MNLPEFVHEADDGALRIAGHRIGIDDIAYCYNDGFSPESMLAEFPTLSLALIHKLIGFYLDHRVEIDARIAASSRAVETARAAGSNGPTLLELRRRLQTTSSAAK